MLSLRAEKSPTLLLAVLLLVAGMAYAGGIRKLGGGGVGKIGDTSSERNDGIQGFP